MSHISIIVGGKPLVLPEDFSIAIEDSNPFFNEVEMFSYPVSIPIDGNRHLLGNMDDVRNTDKLISIENREMNIIIDGISYRHGICKTEEGQEIKDEISFSIQDASQSIDEIIDDMKCSDVPLNKKIKIGEGIGPVYVKGSYKATIVLFLGAVSVIDDSSFEFDNNNSPFILNPLGFSFPFKQVDGKVVESYINTDNPYPFAEYVNTKVCYKHHALDKDGKTSDDIEMDDNTGPYYVLPADRPCSGISFYVLYFFKCLFEYLGFIYDEEDLLKVEDLKRLIFFTTKCEHDMEVNNPNPYTEPEFKSIDEINKWVSDRATDGHCGRISLGHNSKASLSTINISGDIYSVGERVDAYVFNGSLPGTPIEELGKPHTESLLLTRILATIRKTNLDVVSNTMSMYASQKNFPDMSVSSALKSMFNSFGIKFLYDYETRQVKARLIRDIYRNQSEPIEVRCKILSVVKVSEKTTGVRMAYSNESDKKEQMRNITEGVKDYDTDYDYNDYSRINLDRTYSEIKASVSVSDTTCYIDVNTGNAYRYKVDSDAKDVSELNPVLFEVGAYHGVELGDCSEENEDFIIEFVSSFNPMMFTDVNSGYNDSYGSVEFPRNSWYSLADDEENFYGIALHKIKDLQQPNIVYGQVLVPFIDKDMWHENQEMIIQSVKTDGIFESYIEEHITTDESYDVSSTEDGKSPLQTYDWKNAIAIMRGGNDASSTKIYDTDYDGFGNSKWKSVEGHNTISSDNYDNYGNAYDYDGEQFSLKIRSYKTVKDPVSGELIDAINEDKDKKNRGLADTFMKEHFHTILNRTQYRIEILCEPAELAQIPQNWDRKFRIGEFTGWINKVSTSISNTNGIDKVVVELFSL